MLISRTPLRVSFVGGGTDLPAFVDEHGGAVVSTTIDKYVYVLVTEPFEDTIRAGYARTEIVERVDELEHELIREALRATGVVRKIEIVTVADVPAGTGLGSSSAVIVGLLNALWAHKGVQKSADQLAREACRIEIDVLGRPVGRQDAYASAHGGLQALRFDKGDDVRREPLLLGDEQQSRLEGNLLLFYTGRQRSAARILSGIREEIDRNSATVDALRSMRDGALALAGALRDGADSDLVGSALHENWQLKRSLHENVSDDEIDAAYKRARGAGAVGGKLLGAGAGGFLLLYVPEHAQAAVREALRPLRELPFRFESEGSRIVFAGR